MAHDLSTQYRQALETYLDDGGEAPLQTAYELGREALTSELGLLGLVSIHHASVAELITTSRKDDAQQLHTAGRFLQEALSPFEMIRVGNLESNAALRRLNEILEGEARRIAQTLHDEAGQCLATSYLELAAIRKAHSTKMDDHLDNLKSHLDTMHEQLRELSHELRSPVLDNLGLLPALEHLADGFGNRTGLQVKIKTHLRREQRFPQAIETALYRATQEALSNIVRHAQATQVKIWIGTRNNAVYWRIKDNGAGFVVPTSGSDSTAACQGLGLLGIRERVNSLNGDFSIRSAPATGTELQISIPTEEIS